MAEQRDFCFKSFDNPLKYKLKRATKTTWMEGFLLWFVSPKYTTDKDTGLVTVWKIFKGRKFIVDQYVSPSILNYNCRHNLKPNY